MYCIVDIETTGYGSRGNKITEIAIYKFDGEQIVDEFYSLVNPECSIPYNISLLTGIYNETVIGAPKFYEIAREVFLFTEDCIFVAHNVSFDYNTIRKEFAEIGGEFRRKRLCTVRLSRKILPGHKSYSLGKLCHDLNIEITDRHRAQGDALATVQLFELLLTRDSENIIANSQKVNSKDNFLPPLLDQDVYDALPESTGVYYFENKEGDVIYVGKANNIRKRVKQHFQDKNKKEVIMSQLTAYVSYEVMGSELVALLYESHLIKSIKPTYNTAQKRTNEGVGVFVYTDISGYKRLSYSRSAPESDEILRFHHIEDARNFIRKLVREYELCQKLCGLQRADKSCFDFQIKKCQGACIGEEEVGLYNSKLDKALKSIEFGANMYIVDVGREEHERSVISIKDGKYRGFGYVSEYSQINVNEPEPDYIVSYSDNGDIQRIIKGFLNKSSHNLEIITAQS